MNLGRLAISLPLPFHSMRDCAELARRAEREWGYTAAWLAETSGPDAFVVAAAVADATERMTIGTAVVPVYNRTPAVLAMAAGALAQLSGDRFVLGVGSSSHAIIQDWNGIPFEAPLTHVRESVAILRQALAGEKTNFEGKRLRSRGFRLASRPARPVPIYLGALRERMLALTGEVGDGLVLNLFPVSALPKMLAAHRAGGARAGRDVSPHEVVVRFQVAVTDDVPAARNLVRMAFGPYVAAPVYNRFFAWCGFEAEAKAVAESFARGDRAALAAAMTDDLIDRVTILGTAEQCRAQVAEFVAAGVTTPVLAPLAVDRRGVDAVFEAFAPSRTGVGA
jgi:probable F420-dependent oxidoreductase